MSPKQIAPFSRRVCLGLTAAVVARVSVAAAQAPGKLGYLHPATIDPGHSTLRAVSGAWRRLGYVDGESVFMRSAAGDRMRLPGLAQELAGLGVGALIVVGAPTLRAAVNATKDVPLVAIDLETDPVRAGYAASFARPGGRVTGLFMDLPGIAGKWIELLTEAAPRVRKVALAWDPETSPDQKDVSIDAALRRGLEPLVLEVKSAADYRHRLAALPNDGSVGVIQLTTPGSNPWFDDVAASALRSRLPLVTFQKSNARSGALLSYGPVHAAYFPRAAEMADRILRGAKASALPIEGPTNFELALNLGTARQLGLSLPQSLLVRADDVID
jgi:putative ABC transport system substrate-binding protein